MNAADEVIPLEQAAGEQDADAEEFVTDDETAIAELVAMSPLERDRQMERYAKALKVRPTTLRDEVKKQLANHIGDEEKPLPFRGDQARRERRGRRARSPSC